MEGGSGRRRRRQQGRCLGTAVCAVSCRGAARGALGGQESLGRWRTRAKSSSWGNRRRNKTCFQHRSKARHTMLLLCRKEQGISTPSGKERLHSCGRSTPLVAPTPWPLHSLPPAQPGSCLTELVPNYTHPQHVQPGQTSQTLHCTAMQLRQQTWNVVALAPWRPHLLPAVPTTDCQPPWNQQQVTLSRERPGNPPQPGLQRLCIAPQKGIPGRCKCLMSTGNADGPGCHCQTTGCVSQRQGASTPSAAESGR